VLVGRFEGAVSSLSGLGGQLTLAGGEVPNLLGSLGKFPVIDTDLRQQLPQ